MIAIHTQSAPAAIGTYSQAIRSGNTVYLSGQIPLDPSHGQLCSDDITLQIKQVMQNLTAVCKASGGELHHIVKLSVYLTNLQHFPLVNEIMAHYFTQPYPARVVIGVSELPKQAQVEMDAILVLPTS